MRQEFVKLEKKWRDVFVAVNVIVILGSFVFFFVKPQKSEERKIDINIIGERHALVVVGQSVTCLLLLILSSLLFPCMALRKQYAAYQEYKKYFWLQWIGTLLIISDGITIGLFFTFTDRYNEYTTFFMIMVTA